MKILTRTIGLFARLIAGWHLLWASYHNDRKRVHDRRSSKHEAWRDARVKEAEEIETSAGQLAPTKKAPPVELEATAAEIHVVEAPAPESAPKPPPPPPPPMQAPASKDARTAGLVNVIPLGRNPQGEHE